MRDRRSARPRWRTMLRASQARDLEMGSEAVLEWQGHSPWGSIWTRQAWCVQSSRAPAGSCIEKRHFCNSMPRSLSQLPSTFRQHTGRLPCTTRKSSLAALTREFFIGFLAGPGWAASPTRMPAKGFALRRERHQARRERRGSRISVRWDLDKTRTAWWKWRRVVIS